MVQSYRACRFHCSVGENAGVAPTAPSGLSSGTFLLFIASQTCVMQVPAGVGLPAMPCGSFAPPTDSMQGELVSEELLCDSEPCSVRPSVTRAAICSSKPLIL